jgi:hypothetical protein
MPGIDEAVLNATEWLCQKFQLLTGRTNVWLAIQLTNISIVVYFVWAAIYFPAVPIRGARIAVALFCAGVAYVLTQTVFKVSIESAETNAYARVAKGLRNPRRLRDAQLRVSFLTFSLLMLYPVVFALVSDGRLPMSGGIVIRLSIALLGYSLILLTTVLLYVLACDPLPPCPGKVYEWLAVRRQQTAPARARVPGIRESRRGR